MAIFERFLVVLASIWLFLAGCGGPQPPAKSELPSRSYTLAICPSSVDEHESALVRGAQAEIEPLAARNITVNLIVTEIPTSAADQAAMIQDLSGRGVEGLAASCLPGDEVSRAIDALSGAGVAVVTFQNDAPESMRKSFFGMRPYYQGGLAMRVLEQEIGGAGQVAILADSETNLKTADMISGVNKRLESADPAVSVLKTVYCGGDPERAWAMMIEIQKALPDLKGWLWLGPWPLLANETPFEQLNRAKVVSLGLSTETIPFVEQEKIHALIGRDQEAWGGELVRILIDVVDGEKTFRELNWLRPSVLTQDIIKRNRLRRE